MIFTARRHSSAVYAVVLCLSVTCRHYTSMAKRRITQWTPDDSLGILVFDSKDLGEIPTRSTQRGRQPQQNDHVTTSRACVSRINYVSKRVWFARPLRGETWQSRTFKRVRRNKNKIIRLCSFSACASALNQGTIHRRTWTL